MLVYKYQSCRYEKVVTTTKNNDEQVFVALKTKYADSISLFYELVDSFSNSKKETEHINTKLNIKIDDSLNNKHYNSDETFCLLKTEKINDFSGSKGEIKRIIESFNDNNNFDYYTNEKLRGKINTILSYKYIAVSNDVIVSPPKINNSNNSFESGIIINSIDIYNVKTRKLYDHKTILVTNSNSIMYYGSKIDPIEMEYKIVNDLHNQTKLKLDSIFKITRQN